MFFYILLAIISVSTLNSQQFEAKRDLLEEKKTKRKHSFLIGVGGLYSINVIQKKDDSFDCECAYQEYIQDNSFIPNLFIHYKLNKKSDLGFRLNFSYFHQIFDNGRYLHDVIADDEFATLEEGVIFEMNHYDIDFTIHYNPFGFKQIDLFAGIKNRFGGADVNYERKLIFENGEIKQLDNYKAEDDNNYKANYILGLNYIGNFSNLTYNISFFYNSNLNKYNFKKENIPNYQLNSFGIGFNILYEI